MRPISVAIVAVALAGCSVFRTPAPAPHLAHPVTPVEDPDTESIGVTWIGHATVLVRIKDRWFLTDPVFSDRLAGVYGRYTRAGMNERDLPPLDAVLVSHSHFDHLDTPSLRALHPGTPVLVPDGTARYLPHGTDGVALATWETWHDGPVTITAVPASHPSWRYALDFWVKHGHTGYVIEYGDLCVYFAGDTGWDPEQAKAIHERFPDIDVALVPVGPAEHEFLVDRWIRQEVHVDPRLAMRLFDAVGAQWMVPIHYGTFFHPMSVELPLVERAVDGDPRVRILGIGDSTEFLY